MYAAVVRVRAQSGKAHELSERWEQLAGSMLKADPGFRHAYVAINNETDNVISVVMFDTPPDPAQAQQRGQQMQDHLHDLFAEEPTRENYDVVVELQPDESQHP